MTILVTGSQGKTASCLTKYLQASKHPLIVASRNPAPNTPYPVARFDWTDPSTLDLPFQHTQALDSPITAAYLVGIDVTNIAELVIRFIHFARSKGVKRFVLLSALDQPKGNPLLGAIHAELEDLGNRHLVEWAVLRPGFFMENFSEESYHRKTIRSEGRIYTASGKGRKAFISARDIAAVAYRVLVDGEAPNGDLVITGGEAVSHDEVAETIGKVVGKPITHVSLEQEEFKKFLIANGLREGISEWLAQIDIEVSQGQWAETTDIVERITGRAPRSFEDFAMANKVSWT